MGERSWVEKRHVTWMLWYLCNAPLPVTCLQMFEGMSIPISLLSFHVAINAPGKTAPSRCAVQTRLHLFNQSYESWVLGHSEPIFQLTAQDCGWIQRAVPAITNVLWSRSFWKGCHPQNHLSHEGWEGNSWRFKAPDTVTFGKYHIAPMQPHICCDLPWHTTSFTLLITSQSGSPSSTSSRFLQEDKCTACSSKRARMSRTSVRNRWAVACNTKADHELAKVGYSHLLH